MKKDDFEKRMLDHESFNPKVLNGIYYVLRLDGRGFNKLTKSMKCKKPFDDEFRNVMAEIVRTIMQSSGFKIIYGYTESDEISLLFSKYNDSFDRRINKLISVIPSIASSVFTNKTGIICSFDCRISQLPNDQDVIDYFRWRANDSHRNALNGYCYWTLRNRMSGRQATKYLEKFPKEKKHDLLIENGINYNDVLTWHKNGTGFYFIDIEIEGFNPKDNIKVKSIRKKLIEDLDLPFGLDYSVFIQNLLNNAKKEN